MIDRTLVGNDLAQLAQSLTDHRLYREIHSPVALRTFCERHVFCVWDFMTLLKSLQRDLTSVDLPWVPPGDPAAARLINEIVLGEESDEIAEGRHGSHFEWYLEAMDEVGADTAPIRRVVAGLRAGQAIEDLLAKPDVSAEARAFTSVTLSFLEAPLHVRASVFFYGREDLIPRMFLPIVNSLATEGLACDSLLGYLQRHIEVDGDLHGPLARQLLERLYARSATRREEAEHAARIALRARRALWDATSRAVRDADASA